MSYRILLLPRLANDGFEGRSRHRLSMVDFGQSQADAILDHIQIRWVAGARRGKEKRLRVAQRFLLCPGMLAFTKCFVIAAS